MQKPFIAIQVGAVSFVDEGVVPLLDTLEELGKVNALLLATHSFDPGTASRQIKGHPFPDHGVQEYDQLIGGNFATTHKEYYGNTFIRDFKAPDYGPDFDILSEVLPETKKRGIEVHCWITEAPNYNLPYLIPNFKVVLEKDVYGRPGPQPCLNNPDYRNWYLSLYEDYVKSYDIDGLALCSERQGPLGNLLGGGWEQQRITCFCSHCKAVAREKGIDVEMAIRGYQRLDEYFEHAKKGSAMPDGFFVTFWRILLEYPEILAWERLYIDSQFQFYRDLYGTVKAIDPTKKVGWHVMHLNSFSPFYRATQDYAEYSRFSDYLKIALYHSCAGPRFARWVKSLHQHIFRDSTPEESLPFLYRVLNLNEAPYPELSKAGFSAEYVRSETERAVRGTNGEVHIYPGIGIDVPTLPGEKVCTPEDIEQGVIAAFEGGAHGVILSRKYSEMRLENIKAAGRAVEAIISKRR